MIYTFSPFGYEGSLINIEVDVRNGIPAVDIVGLSDGCVKETRERVRCAFINQQLEFPSERVLISLSPEDLKKEGAGFDLAIACGILESQYGLELKDKVLVMGELELWGIVRNVKAINAALSTAVSNGIKFAIIPHSDNLKIPEGMKVKTVGSLTEAYYALCDIADGDYTEFKENEIKEEKSFKVEFEDINDGEECSLDELKGNDGLKYAMAVAVAGRHSIAVWGGNGCGKTAVIQHMPQIMPKLTYEERTSVDRVYSIAGLSGIIKNNRRPFRIPHPTASIEGICGGGVNCRPGEISLAHNGVLFLDEAAEFRTSVLQMLRVPLESGTITLARAGRCTTYPAKFQLVLVTNPCPCGNYGSKDKVCLCSARAVELYWKKFSAPLLDRIDIRYNCFEENTNFPRYTLNEMREHIKLAWERQYARQGKLNADLYPSDLCDIKFSPDAERHLNYLENVGYSPRAIASIKKVAMTLNDMHFNTSDVIELPEIQMAVLLRAATPISY